MIDNPLLKRRTSLKFLLLALTSPAIFTGCESEEEKRKKKSDEAKSKMLKESLERLEKSKQREKDIENQNSKPK